MAAPRPSFNLGSFLEKDKLKTDGTNCNSPVFTKIKKNCFRCGLFDCQIYLRCLHPRFIDRRLFPPLLSRIGRRPTLATLTLDLWDTGFHPITVAKTDTTPAACNGTKDPV